MIAFAALYLFFEFGSTSLTTYQPIWKYERFLTILSVPSAVVAGLVLAELIEPLYGKPWMRRAVPALAALYVCMSAAILEADARFWGSPTATAKETFRRLKQLDVPDTFYVIGGFWSVRGLPLMRLDPRKPARFEQLANRSLDQIHDAVVIFDPSYFDPWGEYRFERSSFDARLFSPAERPRSWKKLFELRELSFDRHASTVEVLVAP